MQSQQLAILALAALLIVPISGIAQAQFNDTSSGSNQTEEPFPPVVEDNMTAPTTDNATAAPVDNATTTEEPFPPVPVDNQTVSNETSTDNATEETPVPVDNATETPTEEPEPLPAPGSPGMQECTQAYPDNPEICEGAFGAEPDCVIINAEGGVYNIKVNPPDPFRLDNDADGLGCEISQLQGEAPSTPATDDETAGAAP